MKKFWPWRRGVSENFSLKKGIATILIFSLVLSQTVQINLFPPVSASAEQYRDIVSIVVDRQTNSRIRSAIDRYARDIQASLGSTRVVISVIDDATTPAMIAAHNEKLFYEGDGDDGVKSRLVGTILVGNVPLPMVNADGKYFPSIFPYVDFDNKAFLYNPRSERYEQVSSLQSGKKAPEIWHGVINPAVGRAWNGDADITMISDFLDKTHNYYTQSGKFAPTNESPKVFYFDGFAESKSIVMRSVFQYGLWIANVENLAYNRFSKYLLTDVNNALKDYDKNNNDGYADIIKSLGISGLNAEQATSNTLSDDLIKTTPDVHTAAVLSGLLKSFHEVFNKKVLGEELAAVHNAGRYNSGASVNADLATIQISVADDVSSEILKHANDALEASFNDFLKTNSIARKIPILDSMTAHYGDAEDANRPYKNYFFGRESTTIQNAHQCTIARGGSGEVANFGRSILVEANAAFDVNATQSHIDLLGQDSAYCYRGGTPALNVFWGGNSLLRVANTPELATQGLNPLTVIPNSRLTGFVRDIYATGGMLESSRIAQPSLSQCMDYTYQYTVEQPHSWEESDRSSEGGGTITRYYPSDTRGDRFRCQSSIRIVSADEVIGHTSSFGRFGRWWRSESIPLRADPNFFNEVRRYFDNTTNCLVGRLTLDGQTWNNNRSCIYETSGSDGESGTRENYTSYRSLKYHTIDGIMYHISPTPEEFAAADANGATPNLPININRSVEFVTKKGNIVKIQYPNFFRTDAKTIPEMRAWLKADSENQWNAIVAKENATTQSEFDANISTNFLGARDLPATFDWNNYISDELITQIIQAKNWLHPDITKKYEQAVESMLSYSGNPVNGDTLQKMPEVTSRENSFYDIAYLGLQPVVPGGEASSEAVSTIQNDYAQKLSAIHGLNITEQNNQSEQNFTPSNSAQCGPPEWVDLFKWPGAISCWIKSQLPPKISAGQCGGDTIGYNQTQSKPLLALDGSSSADSQMALLTGARVIPHFDRKHASYFDSITIDSSLQTEANRFSLPYGSEAKLQIVSVTSAGKTVAPAEYEQYFSLSSNSIPHITSGARFLVSSKDKDFTLTGKISYIIPFTNGTNREITSEEFSITASSAYLDGYLSSENATGIVAVTADKNEKFALNFTRKSTLADPGHAESGISLKILDDISGWEVISETAVEGSSYTLPEIIVRNVGVYRAIFTGKDGIAGEMTFTVRSGELSKIEFVPVSTAIIKDSSTLVTLALQDTMGNAIAPDLYSVEVTAENGSLLDASGNPVKSLSIDIFDSYLSFAVRGDNTGKLKLKAKVSTTLAGNTKNLETEREIDVLPSAKINFVVEWGRAFQIGDTARNVQVQILDENNQIIRGFSSVLSVSLPVGSGTFSKETIAINNGQSEVFAYYPGTVAGQHNLTLNIPGIGIINNTPLTLLPGAPMYIDSSVANGQMTFWTRDRYGNQASYTGEGFLAMNAENPVPVHFENGKLSLPEKNGFYIVEVPEIEKNVVYYDEAGNILQPGNPLLADIEWNIAANKLFRVLPVSKYATQIFSEKTHYSFATDYNARYTVLAGGEFLREWENILYHTDKDNSQSLAVTTLLSSPLATDTLFTLFPGGGYTLGQSSDTVLESNLSIERGFPVLHVTDTVRKNQVASVLYQTENATLSVCQTTGNCEKSRNTANISAKLLVPEGQNYAVNLQGGRLVVQNNNSPLVSITPNGAIETDPSVTLRLQNYDTTFGLVTEVVHAGGVVAEITYHFSEQEGVHVVEDIFTQTVHTAPMLSTTGHQAEKFSDKTLASSAEGVMLKKPLSYDVFDTTKTGPADIDDLGMLSEMPNVGWMENNRTLLSFAAGDSVGESTKWFHTYSLVNMGDPVATVDKNNKSVQTDGIDRSLGTQVADSRRAHIHNFFQKDMNADGLKDIIVQYEDGYIELLVNANGKYRSLGNIAFLPRLTQSLVEVADFQWDKYGDIIALDDQGNLALFSNNESKFIAQDVSIEGGMNAPRHIQQMKVYDMDADGKDDLVYLTSAWELGILYGTATPWVFMQKILDSTLGITLNTSEVDKHGGAIMSNRVEQFNRIVSVDPSNSTSDALSDARIRSEVYYQRQLADSTTLANTPLTTETSAALDRYLQNSDGDAILSARMTGSGADNSLPTIPLKLQTFVRSQYASLVQTDISKKYASPNSLLYPDDTISVEITIKNTAAEPTRGVVYLDTIQNIFARDATEKYSVEVAGQTVEKPFIEPSGGEYALQFEVGDIPANGEAKIRYTLKVLPASYGEMLVGDFEKGTVGHDNFGDISFSTSTTCGAEKLMWTSDNTLPREYHSDRWNATYEAPLPAGLEEKIKDLDGNGIPDSVEKMTPADSKAEFDKLSSSPTKKQDLLTIQKEDKTSVRIGFDQQSASNIASKAQEIANGLSCGFGGGSCMSFPINWAPLAPGNDLVVFGKPVGDGFNVDEGLPFLSALTAINVPTSAGCYQIPVIWPASPIKFTGTCNGEMGAGGYLGTNSPTNFIRLFATPTLTLGMGGAVCLGGPASQVGWNPGKWLFPLVQGGNCIVMAQPMPICKGDGSKEDGDISGISGLGTSNSTREVWNGQSCNLEASPTVQLQADERKLEGEILDYMRSPDSQKDKIPAISVKIAKRWVSSLNNGTPLLNIGNRSVGTDFEVSVAGNGNIANIGKVVDVNNKRIAAFPDFIMNWLTRQTEELTNSLFTPPNLTIIPPTNFGQNAQVDSSYAQFLENLQKAYSAESVKNMQAQMSTAYTNNDSASVVSSRLATGGSSWLGSQYGQVVQNGVNTAAPAINTVGGGLNAMRSAYAFIGKLPFLNIRQTKVDINVPWILPSELDQYERKLKSYQAELDRGLANWCANGQETTECIQAKAKIHDSGFYSSLQQNLKRIDEYRRFPEKLQKYVTWKEKLLHDILCNIQAVEKMTFGWVKDNGIRFQKWAELYVLIKAIAESWQPLIDIFADANASCGVCRNERHNAQQWKFKLISAIIPQIPVISFPKWPDIVLDLSDVRLGIDISVPDFNFRISPMRLPSLPNISLPNSPSASLNLPTLPVLPALPNLPDLPQLPSLPTIKLPDLPPPPKLPKIGGSLKASLDILKLAAQIYCYYQHTMLVPEWQVGDIIAQRTERQGTLSMDFIDVQFPQFSMPEIKEIRVSTHLNYILRSDFITEFAKNAVKPINSFSTDLQNSIPATIPGLDNAANQIQNSINNASNAVRDGVQNIQNSTQGTLNQVQDASNAVDSNFRDTERSLQNSSDAIRTNTQDAVNNAVSYAEYASGMTLENTNNILAPIIAKLDSEKDIFMETDEFAAYLKSELIASGFIKDATALDYKMRAAKIEAENLQKSLEKHNREKFDLMYKFIKEQERKNGELQNIVDMLQQNDEKMMANMTVGQFASSEAQTDSIILAQLAELQNRGQQEIGSAMQADTTALDISRTMQEKVRRIAQLSSSTQAVPEHQLSTNSPASYLPNFRGMYVLTETQHIQTKLFDYTELIDKKDRVDVVDVDNDGDKDYVYLLGGNLYVKNTYLQNPVKIQDNTIKSVNIGTELPEVANNFMQMLSTPSELNISFENTVPGEKEWRLDFFDKYLEWDRIDINNRLATELPRTTLDLVLRTDFGEFQDGVCSLPVSRYLISGQNADWFVLEWPEITKLENDIFASISPNRTLYTGNNSVRITYKTALDPNLKDMILEANRSYQFETTTEIRASGGPLYIIGGGSASHRYTSADNLAGLPIVPGMKITSSERFAIRDATQRNTISMMPNSLYMLRSLGIESDRYNVVVPYPNGYYYARLKHLSEGKNDRAGVLLMAPQLASDKTSPVISLGDSIRVPVYAEQSFALSDIVTELSKYSVTVDPDTTVDENKNGIYDDDFVASGDGVRVTDHDMIFGPFSAPGARTMNLKIRDEFWNTTYAPLTVEIYTPIPTLQTITEDKFLSGVLDTAVAGEPVDFFRIRSSEIPQMINSGSAISNSEGQFSSGSFVKSEEIIVTAAGNSWTVSPAGIFHNLPVGMRTTVTPASTRNPMSINVVDASNTTVYQQFVSLPRSARILDAVSSETATGNLWVTPISPSKFVSAPMNDPMIPGGAYITDAEHHALLVVARDGNIYPIDPTVTLTLSEKEWFILIRALRAGQPIAEFHYKMNFFYTTK